MTSEYRDRAYTMNRPRLLVKKNEPEDGDSGKQKGGGQMGKYRATTRFYVIICVLFIVFSYFILKDLKLTDLFTSVYWR